MDSTSASVVVSQQMGAVIINSSSGYSSIGMFLLSSRIVPQAETVIDITMSAPE
jgi:hypothetical protein